MSELSETQSGFGHGIMLGIAFEIAAHIVVHYTIPGASAAAWLAQSMAPALDAVGLTTVFGGASAATSTASALPSLGTLSAG